MSTAASRRRYRRRGRRAAGLFIGALVVLLVIGWSAVGFYHRALNPMRDAAGPNGIQITADQRTVGAMEVLDCIRQGPSACAQYEEAKDELVAATRGTLEYTPMTASDPGEPTPSGTRRVDLSTASDSDFQAVSVAALRDGAAAPGVLDSNAVTASGDDRSATFVVPANGSAPAVTGTVVYDAPSSEGANDERLLSITYEDEH